MTRFLSLLCASCLLTACFGGDDDDGNGSGADAPPISLFDAAPGSPDGAGACLVTGPLGDLGSKTGTAKSDGETPPGEIYWYAPLNSDTLPDVLSVDLWAKYGVFTDAITTGTFQLTGSETSAKDCGACVYLDIDVNMSSQPATYAETYMPTGGTINITSVTGNLTGTLSNVTLQRVSISPDDGTTTPLGSCTTTISNVAFDGAITSGKRASVRLHLRGN